MKLILEVITGPPFMKQNLISVVILLLQKMYFKMFGYLYWIKKKIYIYIYFKVLLFYDHTLVYF